MGGRDRAHAGIAGMVALLCVWGCAAPQNGAADSGPESPLPESKPKPGRRVRYAPGVMIDFARLQVEADAQVVLRQGMLELLACSPNTKEHESILRVNAKPSRIYQAMGLIGLQPGRPASWDEHAQKRVPPTGEKLSIAITWKTDRGTQRANAWDWLRTAGSNSAPSPRPWMFTGSVRDPDGRLAVDRDGTVVTVVDFGSELIGLAEYHSAENADLWLEAFTERIPPKGTSCTLIFRKTPKAHASN